MKRLPGIVACLGLLIGGLQFSYAEEVEVDLLTPPEKQAMESFATLRAYDPNAPETPEFLDAVAGFENRLKYPGVIIKRFNMDPRNYPYGTVVFVGAPIKKTDTTKITHGVYLINVDPLDRFVKTPQGLTVEIDPARIILKLEVHAWHLVRKVIIHDETVLWEENAGTIE